MAAKTDATAAVAVPRSPAFALVIGAVFSAGVASLIYEVVWVRQLGFSLGSTAVAFSVMLSAFLGGLALGGWYMGKRSDAMDAPARSAMKTSGRVVERAMAPRLPRFRPND